MVKVYSIENRLNFLEYSMFVWEIIELMLLARKICQWDRLNQSRLLSNVAQKPAHQSAGAFGRALQPEPGAAKEEPGAEPA